MTAQEKWVRTIYYMKLVCANYTRIRKGEAYRITGGKDRREIQEMRKWCRAIDRALRTLRLRKGKSAARARRDWLVAHLIESLMLGGEDGERIRRDISGHYLLNRRYMDAMWKEAVAAVQKAAQEEGLLGE